MVPFCYGEELFIWGARQAVFVTGCCVYYRRFSRISSLCSLFSLSCNNQSVSRHCHVVQEAKLPWAGLITTALQNTWVQNFIYGAYWQISPEKGGTLWPELPWPNFSGALWSPLLGRPMSKPSSKICSPLIENQVPPRIPLILTKSLLVTLLSLTLPANDKPQLCCMVNATSLSPIAIVLNQVRLAVFQQVSAANFFNT